VLRWRPVLLSLWLGTGLLAAVWDPEHPQDVAINLQVQQGDKCRLLATMLLAAGKNAFRLLQNYI
jgi:hypothetical protein